jgi:GR25 family glycosyltransferase involved in LPS biosynthesis
MAKSNGLDNFDIIYFINLQHRTDRLNHISNELMKTNINPSKIHRINGVYHNAYGAIGCTKSHILALETFIDSGKENCIIFEDDFTFIESQDNINKLINDVFNHLHDYDLLMLASDTYNEQATEFSFVTKIIDAQTTAGYVVSKKFAPVLLSNYKESLSKIENQFEELGYTNHDFCLDIYMKQLQPISKWYCISPKIGKQLDGYSDISKNCKYNNY